MITPRKVKHKVVINRLYFLSFVNYRLPFPGAHLDEYTKLGHPYVRNYVLSSNMSWVLCMNPLMTNLLSEAEFAEADVTYKASVEFEYLFNMVVFNHSTLRCKKN